MEIHIAHPSYTNNAYARGIGFAYGGNFGLYTTSWDKDGVYQGMKTVLTEENGVMLTGNQTIGGVKTLSGGMLKIDRSGRLAEIGVGAADTYLMNRTSNKALQLKDDGTLAYSNDKIMLYSDRSDAVNLNDTSKLATSRAVKTAYDKAAAAETAAGLAGPAGTVAFIAGAYAPAGWLKCNGAAVSRTTYAKLFAAIGTHYGAGNGSTTFNLPDLRGEFIRCLDDGRGVDVGRVLGTVQTDAMQQWFAELTLQRAQVNREEIVNGAVQFLSSDKSNAIPGGGWAVSRTIIGPAVNNSARTAAETRPRNIALLPIIKI
ncbi:tail fiber protein [Neisseria animalis]|uniref:Tail fiber protein n=2 Tax=Neisseria animalis TaxID=492 RepID=A0A5P3MW99_NEIAN|nr:tail fiber protein [Neisseria animalis]ROW32250.1 tail fiber protein [Neisseria animalis]